MRCNEEGAWKGIITPHPKDRVFWGWFGPVRALFPADEKVYKPQTLESNQGWASWHVPGWLRIAWNCSGFLYVNKMQLKNKGKVLALYMYLFGASCSTTDDRLIKLRPSRLVTGECLQRE